jgi:hypothetical protein
MAVFENNCVLRSASESFQAVLRCISSSLVVAKRSKKLLTPFLSAQQSTRSIRDKIRSIQPMAAVDPPMAIQFAIPTARPTTEDVARWVSIEEGRYRSSADCSLAIWLVRQ